jgi:hypothetical protein
MSTRENQKSRATNKKGQDLSGTAFQQLSDFIANYSRDIACPNHANEVSSASKDEEWEKIEYKETEEGQAPSSISGGHFGFKVGTKRWNKTLYSVDWNKRVYSDSPVAENASKK